ncbi:hypothetical protein [Lacinutrix mariniflava]|uniref:hypothetical protein n=1 Tax=Lacinutrix mariniflava TaxID=342955 RepID=UPI0006E1C988|nr:hypothetical protein [Lacinutrix mariniflava]
MNFFKNTIFSILLKKNTTVVEKRKSLETELEKKEEHCKYLHDNLKQLEFISCFEMYLDGRKENSYSLSFLQELNAVKDRAELNTLEAIAFFKT